MNAHDSSTDGSDTPDTAGRHRPRAVFAAVAILGVLGLSGLLSLVHDLVVAVPPMIDAFVGVAIDVVISLLLGWFLWWGSNAARVWTIVLTALWVVIVVTAAAVAGVGPLDVYLVWTLVETALGVVLLVLLFAPATRRWSRRSRPAQAAVASPDLSCSKEQ